MSTCPGHKTLILGTKESPEIKKSAGSSRQREHGFYDCQNPLADREKKKNLIEKNRQVECIVILIDSRLQ